MTNGVDRVAAQAAGMDPDRLDALVDFLDRTYLASGRLPHMQLLVSRDEQPVVSWARGAARASGESLSADALYRIASMTKPVTSVAFMMLVEAGKVALDTPVVELIPEFADLRVGRANRANRARLKRPMLMIDLLRHTSGLTYGLQRQTPIDARYRKLGLDEFQQPRTSDQFIADLATLPLEFSPGERWNYSVATDVLGAVIQRVSGMKLDEFYRTRIFEPLGMHDTFFAVPEDKVHRLTDCYDFVPGGKPVMFDRGEKSAWSRSPRFLSGGGGLVSTALDYHRFCSMCLNGGTLDGVRIVGRKTIDLMTRNHLPGGADLASMSKSLFSEAANAGTGFGLGFAVNIDVARSMIPGSEGEYYWGGMFSTAFFIDPVERIHMVFMTQLRPSSAYPIRRELKTLIYSALT